MSAVGHTGTMTVEEVLEWAGAEGIDLGTNPRRMLVHLAGQGIIPKSVRGPNCKGVYDRRIITDRLRFYQNRRAANWRPRDIRQALQRLDAARDRPTSSAARLARELERRGTEDLMALPLETTFRRLFRVFEQRRLPFTAFRCPFSAWRTLPTTKRGISALISLASSMKRVL